jgi:imidazolonepropionase-like amidohydrolase
MCTDVPCGLLRWAFLAAAAFTFGSCAAAQTGDLVIEHVTVINPGDGTQFPDTTVVVRGGEIASVAPLKGTKTPRTAQIVDGSGKFLIPGLWDMHTHFRSPERDLKLYVANGILGIRDMGGAAERVYPLREKIAKGQLLGPKIVASGAIVDGPDSFSNPEFTVSVGAAEQAQEAVAKHRREGADFIKVYDGLSRDAYFAIIEEAKLENISVAGHLPAAISVRDAAAAGQQSLEHGMPLAGGSTMEEEYIKWALDRSVFQEALRTKNFVIIPEKIARDNTAVLNHFEQPRADEAYKILASNRTFLTPTLVTERSLAFIDELVKTPDPRMAYVAEEKLNWWKPENGVLTKYRTPE